MPRLYVSFPGCNLKIMKKALLVGMMLVGGMLAAAATAYACTASASIILDDKAAVLPGQEVHGSGEGFSASDAAGDVAVHFNSLSGDVVWSGSPAGDGTISFSFTVPEGAEAGHYTITATQYLTATRQMVPGTPARDVLKVTVPQSNPQSPPAATGTSPDSGAPAGSGSRVDDPGTVTTGSFVGNVSAPPASRLAVQGRAIPSAQQQASFAAQFRVTGVGGSFPAERSASVSKSMVVGPSREGAPTSALTIPILMLLAGVLFALGALAYLLAQMRTRRYAPADSRIR